MKEIDPKIEVTYALQVNNGNQAELGRKLGVGRASVNEWVRTGRQYLPELQAHRFVILFGSQPENPLSD